MFISELNLKEIFDINGNNFSCSVTVYDNDEGKNFAKALISYYQPIYFGKAEWPAMSGDGGRFWNGLQVHETIKSGLAYLVNNSVEKGSLIFINEDSLESSSLDDVRKVLTDYKVFFLCRIDRKLKNRVNLKYAGKMKEYVNCCAVLYPDNLMGYSTIDVMNFKSGNIIDSKRYKLDNLKVRIIAEKVPPPEVDDSNPKNSLLRRLAHKAEDDLTKLEFLNEKMKTMLNRSIGVPFVMKELSCDEDQARRILAKFKHKLGKSI